MGHSQFISKDNNMMTISKTPISSNPNPRYTHAHTHTFSISPNEDIYPQVWRKGRGKPVHRILFILPFISHLYQFLLRESMVESSVSLPSLFLFTHFLHTYPMNHNKQQSMVHMLNTVNISCDYQATTGWKFGRRDVHVTLTD